MADAGINSARIGVWTDYSKPRALGSTLTLRNRDAAVLLAFLATIVSLSATRGWRLSRFILYQLFADREHHVHAPAHQVVLRNAETATGAGLGLFELLVRPRDKSPFAKAQLWRQVVVLAGAFGHWVFFVIAAVMTSQILLGSTVVSRVTETCGKWNFIPGDKSQTTVWAEFALNQSTEAENYVRNCYSEFGSLGLLDCGKLENPTLPINVRHDVACPFPSAQCVGGGSKGFEMDTGNLSFAALGLNCKYCNRLFLRKRTVCAPLRSTPFSLGRFDNKNITANIPSLPGTLLGDDEDWMAVYNFLNYTKDEPGYHWVTIYRNIFLSGYEITPVILHSDMTNMTLNAPTLRFSDDSHGPVLILMSGLGVLFEEKQDDPFWSVHTLRNANSTPPLYAMDYMLNMLGCDEQAQLCSSYTDQCSPWRGILSPDTGFQTILVPGGEKNAMAYYEITMASSLVSQFLVDTSITTFLTGREGNGNMLLKASQYFRSGRQYRLEAEQWKTELKHWFSISLARLQLGIFHSIEKPKAIDTSRAVNQWDWNNSTLKLLCGRIKYRSPAHTSLSFFGVMFVLVVSLLLITLSFFEVFLARLLKKWLGERMTYWDEAENLALLEEQRKRSDRSDEYPNDEKLT